MGSQNTQSVLAIQGRLNALGCGPVVEDGVFGQQTLSAVELFQSRSVDPRGLHLQVDGNVGPMTWAALFGTSIPRVTATGSAVLAKVLEVAASQVGVLEQPLGSNRGPQVDQYVRSVGLDPAGHFPWCAAFVYWCFQQAESQLGVGAPSVVKTGSVLDHWNQANASATIHCLSQAECAAEPSVVQPGMIFIIINPSGTGHTGLVEAVAGATLTTIEGNTNNTGSREGIGVFRRTTRTIGEMRGFIDYGS